MCSKRRMQANNNDSNSKSSNNNCDIWSRLARPLQIFANWVSQQLVSARFKCNQLPVFRNTTTTTTTITETTTATKAAAQHPLQTYVNLVLKSIFFFFLFCFCTLKVSMMFEGKNEIQKRCCCIRIRKQ